MLITGFPILLQRTARQRLIQSHRRISGWFRRKEWPRRSIPNEWPIVQDRVEEIRNSDPGVPRCSGRNDIKWNPEFGLFILNPKSEWPIREVLNGRIPMCNRNWMKRNRPPSGSRRFSTTAHSPFYKALRHTIEFEIRSTEKNMKVVLFRDGIGIRMREYSEVLPKTMVPIGYRPILQALAA
jgi:hypothetical protein